MHDWVFLGLNFLWDDGSCVLKFRDASSAERQICASGIKMLVVPRLGEWGESVCVNQVSGPFFEDGIDSLKMQMQSGDQIIIQALKINMP